MALGGAALWGAVIAAPPVWGASPETDGDIRTAAGVATVAAAVWIMLLVLLAPLKRRVDVIEDGISYAHGRLEGKEDTPAPLHAVREPESGAL